MTVIQVHKRRGDAKSPRHSHLRFSCDFILIRDSLLNFLSCISVDWPLMRSGITRYTGRQIMGFHLSAYFFLTLTNVMVASLDKLRLSLCTMNQKLDI